MTSKAWNVFHVTDFHISNPSGDDEHLRLGYFEEYLRPLSSLALSKASSGIDCMVITGDFVDRGDVKHFGHAKTVTDYLTQQLGLSGEKVAVCLGNHDFDRKVDLAGESKRARQAFREFAKNYANGKHKFESDRAVLCCPSTDVWCLIVDATLGCGGEDREL